MANTTVKERPILFSGPMVRAILAGHKTQTRRMVKPQPKPNEFDSPTACKWYSPTMVDRHGEEYPGDEVFGIANENRGWICPYGAPGERLYVRETLEAVVDTKFDESEAMPIARYAADCSHIWTPGPRREPWIWKNRALPSIHMPRRLSRIILEITGVRAEWLQDISEDDAKAEGCDGDCPVGSIPAYLKGPHSYHYAQLWDQINGFGAWDLNPWVWVVEFKRIAL